MSRTFKVAAIIAILVMSFGIAIDEGQSLLRFGTERGLTGEAAFLVPMFGLLIAAFVVAYLAIKLWPHRNDVANDA